MAEKPRRLRQITLAGLMAVVAGSALLFARLRPNDEAIVIREAILFPWQRPIDETTAVRVAGAFLEQRHPGRYRVIGIAKGKSRPGYRWAVSFSNAPGGGSPTFGLIHVDAGGKAEMSIIFID